MDILHSLLAKLGLTENQRKTYLSLLSLGAAAVSTIASKANIHRVTCNDSLKQLCAIGLASCTKKNSITIYAAKDPEGLIEQQNSLVDQLRDALPLFRSLMEYSSTKPILSYHNRLDEIKSIYNRMLRDCQGIVCSILWSEITNHAILEFIDGEFEQKRIWLWIIQQVICSTTIIAPWIYHQQERLREKLYIQNNIFVPECGIHIYWDDKIMATFLMWDNCSAAIIENIYLHNTLLSIFQTLRTQHSSI